MTSVAREPTTMPTFGHEADVAVGDDVGVLGQLDGGVLLDERIGRRAALGGRARCRDSTHATSGSKRAEDPECMAKNLVSRPGL